MKVVFILTALALVPQSSPNALTKTSRESDYPITPVVATRVGVEDSFWKSRIEVNRTVTIPFAIRKCEDTGRIENFKVAGGLSDKTWSSSNGYDDSDVSKVIEGASYSLMTHPDQSLENDLSRIAGYYKAAQEDDGYLYTLWTARHTIDIAKVRVNPGNDRWGRIDFAHQLYNAGHMYEAGVAHFHATGDRTLLDVCLKNADCICTHFGPGKIELPPGHQEIEIGLAKLARESGDSRYLDMAKYFLDIRGKKTKSRDELYGLYSQDHKPVVDQTHGVGHSVRACYMYAAMADIAAMNGDQEYVDSIERIWNHVVTRQMYLTGGVGAEGGHEGFGGDYELPNLSAYCETCAAIAMCMWNHRMFLMTGRSEFIDILERSLYNGVISGVSLGGDLFFYPNPLESDGRHERSPWFQTSCCPSNLCRFIPSVPGYAYATKGNDLYVNLFMEGESKIELESGKVTVSLVTNYPWDGKLRFVVNPDNRGQSMALRVRIPGWARGDVVPGNLYEFSDGSDSTPSFKVSGPKGVVNVNIDQENGYAVIKRNWEPGDSVEVDLPMEVRRVVAHKQVVADRGRTALQRGPIVYCIEHPDVEGGRVLNLVLARNAKTTTEFQKDFLGGVQVIAGEALAAKQAQTESGVAVQTEPVAFKAIPYYAWAHRGKGEMAVWIAEELEATLPIPLPTIASQAIATASRGDVTALADLKDPQGSNDHSNRFLHTWPRKDDTEWVQYDFEEPTHVSAVELYWFDDEPRGGGCRVPESWKLLYQEDDVWVEIRSPSSYGCERDEYNRCEFEPITTKALRVVIELKGRWSTGIHEWRVE